MSVRLVLYGMVKDGMMDAFQDVGAPMVAVSEAEPGTTTYKWFVSDDGHFVNEDVYADGAAMFAHVGAATQSGMLNEYMAAIDLAEIMVLDPVSDEAAEALAGMGRKSYSMVMGF